MRLARILSGNAGGDARCYRRDVDAVIAGFRRYAILRRSGTRGSASLRLAGLRRRDSGRLVVVNSYTHNVFAITLVTDSLMPNVTWQYP